jgi:hypothetical protein
MIIEDKWEENVEEGSIKEQRNVEERTSDEEHATMQRSKDRGSREGD